MTCAACPAARAQPATFVFDPEHSFVHFEVLHFNTSTLRGRFGPLNGFVVLDAAAGQGELSLRIPTAGVDTGLKVFDARLRRDDLLASDVHPEAFFVARQFRYFEGELKRSDFGATFALPFVADTVRLVVQVQGTRR